jgi:hypothetical protein
MQGYMEIAPAGTRVATIQRPDPKQVTEIAALMRHQ